MGNRRRYITLSKHSNNESKLDSFTKILDTETGGAMISGAVGLLLLQYYPKNPKAQKLAEELRITSMTTIGNELVDSFVQQVLPSLVQTFSSLPEAEKKRIVENFKQETSEIFLKESDTLNQKIANAN